MWRTSAPAIIQLILTAKQPALSTAYPHFIGLDWAIPWSRILFDPDPQSPTLGFALLTSPHAFSREHEKQTFSIRSKYQLFQLPYADFTHAGLQHAD
jgi:hypothetical protein